MSPTHHTAADDPSTENNSCSMQHQTNVLCILDGFGISSETTHNPIHSTPTPVWDMMKETGSYAELEASGEAVGLPHGQMGNSEVGHLTIGTGRVVDQELVRIQKAVDADTLKLTPGFCQFVEDLKSHSGTAHVAGLFSPGGVHSHSDHIQHIVRVLCSEDIPVALHLFLDGRDTPPSSAHDYVNEFVNKNADIMSDDVKIASISGRYYAMDRDKRWDRTQLAYEAITNANAPKYKDPCSYIEECYYKNNTDEFVIPAVSSNYNGIGPNDGIFMANFRADRMRQITSALVMPDFVGFKPTHAPISVATSISPYSTSLSEHVTPIFTPADIRNTLGEVCAKEGMKQLRLAETEKYAHVTYFLNGGVETPSPGEERKLISSPKVATYDLQPEMSGEELTNTLVNAIDSENFNLIVVNYANPDMVGHTGNEKATSQAIAAIDVFLGRIHEELQNHVGNLFITADHGNAEKMYDATTQQPHTAHTTALVPFVHMAYGYNRVSTLCPQGTLADIAPTLLEIMDISKPKEMTGKSLFITK